MACSSAPAYAQVSYVQSQQAPSLTLSAGSSAARPSPPPLQLPVQAFAAPTTPGPFSPCGTPTVGTPVNAASTQWRTVVCPSAPHKTSHFMPSSMPSSNESTPRFVHQGGAAKTPKVLWPSPATPSPSSAQSSGITLSAAFPETFWSLPRQPVRLRRACTLPAAPEGVAMEAIEADPSMSALIPPEPMDLNRRSSESEVENLKAGESTMPHMLVRSPKNFARSKTLGGAPPQTEAALFSEQPSLHIEDAQTPSPDKLRHDGETMTPSPVRDKIGHDRQRWESSIYASLTDKASRISGSGSHGEGPLQSRLVYDSVWNRF
eukprot:TRINITY_DN2848_c0_g1_i1.p1 TRINITY_DN2848_c0_g1~~TRINITY_DN2848_c0_g1_i1.p1  ORF type:complete len:319 (-),score=38.70 TRINITY_DN2848_c0_g1_i1:192-1148(-)